MKTRTKVILITIGILTLAWFGIHVYRANCDAPPPDVEDLQVTRQIVSDDANAFTYFVEATYKLYWPTNASDLSLAMSQGKEYDEVAIRDIVEKNQEVFDLMDKGLACTVWQGPEISSFAATLPYIASMRNLGRAMAMRVVVTAKKGEFAEALKLAAKIVSFGHMVEDNPNCLITYLVGIAIEGIGLNNMQKFLIQGSEPPTCYIGLAATLNEAKLSGRGIVTAMKSEYTMSANEIDNIAMGQPPVGMFPSNPNILMNAYSLQPNRTKARLGAIARAGIGSADSCYAKIDDRLRPDADGGSSPTRIRRMLDLIKVNAVGEVVLNMLLPAYDSVFNRKCRLECMNSGVRLMLALKAFKIDTGVYPPDLNVLVPKYLPAVPRDPFDGKSFRYDKERRIVWCVGEDLRDSNGSTAVKAGRTVSPGSQGQWDTEDCVFCLEPESVEAVDR